MKTFINSSFEKMLNRYLSLDPESKHRLNALEGKVITMEFLIVPILFQLKINSGKITLISGKVETADVIIKGTPLSLLHMSLSKTDRKRFFADGVSIEGDLELGQQIIDLFDEIEIDWEEHFSRVIGDIPAHQVGRFIRSVKSFTQRASDIFAQNVNEYVHEEKLLFPQRELLQDFFSDIDILRTDVDRLEIRVQNALKKLSPHEPGSGGMA